MRTSHRTWSATLLSSTLLSSSLLLLGSGSRAEDWFGPPVITQLPVSLSDASVGELTGDERTDLIVGQSLSINHHSWLLLRSIGSGGFDSIAVLPCTFGADASAVGDFNGDGRNDIVVSDSPAKVWYASADREFPGPPVNVPIGTAPQLARAFLISDLDLDGADDLLAESITVPSGVIRVAWGSPSGLVAAGFYLQIEYGLGPNCPPGEWVPNIHLQDVADVDGDGWLDICVDMVWDGGCGTYRGFGYVRGTGVRMFASDVEWIEVVECAGACEYRGVDAERFDADGIVDIIAADETGMRWFRGLGGGGFEVGGSILSYPPDEPRAIELDFDGRVDLISMSYLEGVHVYEGQADGAFEYSQELFPPSALWGFGEFDEMAGIDVVIVSSGLEQVRVFPNIVAEAAAVTELESGSGVRLRVAPSVATAGPVRVSRAALAGAPERVAERVSAPLILDVVGRRVSRTRASSGVRSSEFEWDLMDEAGRPVPSGAYWVVDGASGARARLTVVR